MCVSITELSSWSLYPATREYMTKSIHTETTHFEAWYICSALMHSSGRPWDPPLPCPMSSMLKLLSPHCTPGILQWLSLPSVTVFSHYAPLPVEQVCQLLSLPSAAHYPPQCMMHTRVHVMVKSDPLFYIKCVDTIELKLWRMNLTSTELIP